MRKVIVEYEVIRVDNLVISRYYGISIVMVVWLVVIGNLKVFFIWRVMVVIFFIINYNIIVLKKWYYKYILSLLYRNWGVFLFLKFI